MNWIRHHTSIILIFINMLSLSCDDSDDITMCISLQANIIPSNVAFAVDRLQKIIAILSQHVNNGECIETIQCIDYFKIEYKRFRHLWTKQEENDENDEILIYLSNTIEQYVDRTLNFWREGCCNNANVDFLNISIKLSHLRYCKFKSPRRERLCTLYFVYRELQLAVYDICGYYEKSCLCHKIGDINNIDIDFMKRYNYLKEQLKLLKQIIPYGRHPTHYDHLEHIILCLPLTSQDNISFETMKMELGKINILLYHITH